MVSLTIVDACHTRSMILCTPAQSCMRNWALELGISGCQLQLSGGSYVVRSVLMRRVPKRFTRVEIVASKSPSQQPSL